jgi:hypothetical protein
VFSHFTNFVQITKNSGDDILVNKLVIEDLEKEVNIQELGEYWTNGESIKIYDANKITILYDGNIIGET